MLIGISAPKQSGKSTLAKHLESKGFEHYSFAQPIKEALSVITGLPYDWFDNQETKELPIAFLGNVTGRYMAQTLGSEWARNLINTDFWTIIAAQRLDSMLKSGKNIVIADVRFENEADMIRKEGGVIIHLKRTGRYFNTDHVSEAGIEEKENDLIIYNDSTIEALQDQVDTLLYKIRLDV